MKDFICLGNTPINEPCVQVDKDIPYLSEMREECSRFKSGLRWFFKEILCQDIYFEAKLFSHESGPYFEVVVFFDNESKEQTDIAFEIESNIPETWEELENSKYERK